MTYIALNFKPTLFSSHSNVIGIYLMRLTLYNQCLGNVTSTYDVYLGTIETTNCKNDCESEG